MKLKDAGFSKSASNTFKGSPKVPQTPSKIHQIVMTMTTCTAQNAVITKPCLYLLHFSGLCTSTTYYVYSPLYIPAVFIYIYIVSYKHTCTPL